MRYLWVGQIFNAHLVDKVTMVLSPTMNIMLYLVLPRILLTAVQMILNPSMIATVGIWSRKQKKTILFSVKQGVISNQFIFYKKFYITTT
jgi:hypothetical protein